MEPAEEQAVTSHFFNTMSVEDYTSDSETFFDRDVCEQIEILEILNDRDIQEEFFERCFYTAKKSCNSSSEDANLCEIESLVEQQHLEIRRLSKDVKKYEQAIMNLKSEMQLQRDVPKKDVEVMVGMCCPAKSESANEQVRALRKVNLSLSEELHALRRVCAALDEQLRAATTRTALKDDIIREMRRQLKQAKAKEGKKEVQEASANIPPLLEENLLDTVSSDPFMISMESLEEIENSFFEQLRLNDGLLCPGQPRYEDIAHNSKNNGMARSIRIDEKTTFIIEPDVTGGDSLEEMDYTTFLAQDSGQDSPLRTSSGPPKPADGSSDQFSPQTPSDNLHKPELESSSPGEFNTWAAEDLPSSTRQFDSPGQSHPHTLKYPFWKPDTDAESPVLVNSQTSNEPPSSFRQSEPKSHPGSKNQQNLNYTFYQSVSPGSIHSQTTDEPSSARQSNPGPSNPQTSNDNPREPGLKPPFKACQCRPLRRTCPCSRKPVSSRTPNRSDAGAKYPCSTGKSANESPRVTDREVNHPCPGSKGPSSSYDEDRPSIAATVAAVVKDIVNKIASNFIGTFAPAPPVNSTPPPRSPRRGVQFSEPHENIPLRFDSEVEELYFNRDLKKSGASVYCDLYEELKSVASLCEGAPTTSSPDKTQDNQDSGTGGPCDSLGSDAERANLYKGKLLPTEGEQLFSDTRGPCDSLGSDADRAEMYKSKLLATEQVLANKEEILRIQAKSLNVAEERITLLTCRAQQIKRELDRCQAELNAQRKRRKTNEASTSTMGATTAIRPALCDKCCGTAVAEPEVETQTDMVVTLQNNLSVIEDLYRECFYEAAKQEEMIEKLRKSYLDVRLMEKRRRDQVGRLEGVVGRQKCSLDRCQDIAEEVDTLKLEISNFLSSSNNDSGMWEQSVGGDSSGEIGETRNVGEVSRDFGEELQEIKHTLHTLRDVLQAESSETSGLKKEIEKLKESNRTLQGQLREAQEVLVVLKEENVLMKESNNSLKDQLREAQEQLVELKNENEKLKKSNTDLKDQLVEVQQRVALLQGSLDDKDKVIRLFKDDNEVLCRQVESLQQECKAAVGSTIELECLRDQLRKGQEILQEKCGEVCQLKQRCADLEKAKEGLEDRLQKDDQIIKENARIRAEVHTLSQQVSTWRSQLGDSEERVRRVEAELQNARARAKTMDQCYRDKANAAAALQSQLEDAHARGAQLCAEARRVVATVRGWVRRAQDTNSKQEKVIRKQNAIIESLQQELAKLKDRKKSQENHPCVCSDTTNDNVLSPRINSDQSTSFKKQVFFHGNVTCPNHAEIRTKRLQEKISPKERIVSPDDNHENQDSISRATPNQTCIDYLAETASSSMNCLKCPPRKTKLKRKINKSSGINKESGGMSSDENVDKDLDCERVVCALRAMESFGAGASETASISQTVGVSETADTQPAPPRRLLKKQRCADRIAHFVCRKPVSVGEAWVQQPALSEARTSSRHFSPPALARGIPAHSVHRTTPMGSSAEVSTSPSPKPTHLTVDPRYPSRIPVPRAGLSSAEELFERVERLQDALEDGQRRWTKAKGHDPPPIKTSTAQTRRRR